MLRTIQKLTVAIVLRFVHAAIVELYKRDSRAREELDNLPDGMSYALETGHLAPQLFVQWQGGKLHRRTAIDTPTCALQIKSLPLSFLLFTGQMGLAQAYAQHAFTMKGDVADVMRLARLVNLVEAYLFPKFITKHILTDIPKTEVCFLRIYGAILLGFLTCRYRLS